MGRFSIISPVPGETLNGLCLVTVEVYEQYIPFRALSLRLDGVDLKSGVLQPPLTLPGPRASSVTRKMIFTLDTHDYANGDHVLEVCDERDGIAVRTPVRFENIISGVWYDPIFFPSLDAGDASGYAHIRAVIMPGQEWSVEIQDSWGSPIRRFRGRGEQIDVQWQGHNNEGQAVENEQYELIIRAVQSGVSIAAGGIIKAGD